MRARDSWFPWLAAFLCVIGCAKSQPKSASNPPSTSASAAPGLPADIVGVTWQWVSITTPVEQVTVDTPERYTIRFESDARVTVRADCNRGGAGYSVTADRGIAITPIALTRMACPEGSLSDRFAKEVGRASSYFQKDGDLFLELPVDSGTLRFRREQ